MGRLKIPLFTKSENPVIFNKNPLVFFQGDEDIKDDLLDDASQSEGELNSQSDEGDGKSDGAGDSSAPNSPGLKKRRARRAD